MELAADVVRLSELAPPADRCLPVDESLVDLFPEGGLVPGQVVGASGPAAYSLALLLVARAVTVGSWLAIVGLDDLGIEAAIEFGVPASRVVRVDAGGSSLQWSERVAASIEGFDLVLARPPARGDAALRRVRQRLRARGAVLILVEPPGVSGVSCDVGLATSQVRWIGIRSGSGALMARSVSVAAAARRRPRPIERELWLPDAHRYRLVC